MSLSGEGKSPFSLGTVPWYYIYVCVDVYIHTIYKWSSIRGLYLLNGRWKIYGRKKIGGFKIGKLDKRANWEWKWWGYKE